MEDTDSEKGGTDELICLLNTFSESRCNENPSKIILVSMANK